MTVCTEMTQERPPDRLRWPQGGPILRGWLACDFEKPISDNPHEPYTDDFWEWRDGWFARNDGLDAVIPCDSWSDVPSE